VNPIGAEVTVHKRDPAGREVWRWHGVVVETAANSIRLVARFNGEEAALAGLRFSRGDRFLETYYADRGYNVFAVFDGVSGPLKGWYCNVTRPARLGDGHINFEDLAVDLLVLPDGTAHILDEDEFQALSLDEAERASALASLAELQALAAERRGPFAASANVLPAIPAP
jgi:predicted RNA-binding protein associated with RNAse of E/G family